MIQPAGLKLTVLVMVILIPATGLYSFMLVQKQARLAEQAMTMAVAGPAGERVWAFNDKLPIVLGTGSVLSFLEANPVDRIIVIYTPLMWNVSERILLIESQGLQHAYYPSDMELRYSPPRLLQRGGAARWSLFHVASSTPPTSNWSSAWNSVFPALAPSPKRTAGRQASAACCRSR